MTDWVAEWRAWWHTVTPEFAFLLALGPLLALLGWLADLSDDQWPRRPPRRRP